MQPSNKLKNLADARLYELCKVIPKDNFISTYKAKV